MNQEKPWKTLENQSKLGNLDVVQTLAQAFGIAGPHKIIQNILLYHCPPEFHSLLGLSLQQVDDWYMSKPWCPGEHLTVLTSVA